MPIEFKVWHSSSMANTVAIGITVNGNKNSFYGGRLPYHETFYYNPETKIFNPDCMKCWFPAKDLAKVRLEFLAQIVGGSFQKFLGES
jgi:hypothetical protein